MSKQINIAPIDCRERDFLKISRDNLDAGDFWILSDGHTVSIHEQKSGEASKQEISVPREVFNKLVRWYVRPQKIRKERK